MGVAYRFSYAPSLKALQAQRPSKIPCELEREALLKSCQESSNEHLYLTLVLALSTGMRQEELTNLRWENIDFFKERLTLHETKNGEIRTIPIRALALQPLLKQKKISKKDIGLLFPSKEDPQKPIDLRLPWEKALKKRGIENYKWHDNRHSCASYLLMNGASLPEIAEVLGHKTLSMVKRYAHLSDTHTSKVIERMNQQIFS